MLFEYWPLVCTELAAAVTTLFVIAGGGKSPSWARVSVQADVILLAEQHGQRWEPRQPLVAAFAPQPRSVLVAAGSRLLRCSEAAPGAAPGTPTLAHSRPTGEDITAMATLPDVRPLALTCGRGSAVPNGHGARQGLLRMRTPPCSRRSLASRCSCGFGLRRSCNQVSCDFEPSYR